jgi:hypothetical protein
VLRASLELRSGQPCTTRVGLLAIRTRGRELLYFLVPLQVRHCERRELGWLQNVPGA